MRSFILFITILLLAVLVHSTPINQKRLLVNRPKEYNLYKRSAQTKGGKPDMKDYNPLPPISLRKGEYICGNRVCKLKPGEIPKGCNGICQYPIDMYP